jgi:hypothetical protein
LAHSTKADISNSASIVITAQESVVNIITSSGHGITQIVGAWVVVIAILGGSSVTSHGGTEIIQSAQISIIARASVVVGKITACGS